MHEEELILEKKPGVQQIDTGEILRSLYRRRWFYLFCATVMGMVSFYIFRFYIFTYESTVSFYVGESTVVTSPGLDMRGVENLSPHDNFNRIYQLVNSTPVHMHLIRKFNLLKHYDIDTTKEFYMETAVKYVSSNIRVSKTPYNTIVVTVSDPYRYIAAEMANEIVAYTEKVNREVLVAALDNKIRISGSMIDQLRSEYESKSRSIDSLLRIMSAHSKENSKGMKAQIDANAREQKLSELLFILQSSTRELINTMKLYTLAKQAIIEKNQPVLIPITKAMPMDKSLNTKAAGFAFLVSALCVSIIVLMTYIRLRYMDYFRIFFPGKGFPASIK